LRIGGPDDGLPGRPLGLVAGWQWGCGGDFFEAGKEYLEEGGFQTRGGGGEWGGGGMWGGAGGGEGRVG